MQTSIGMIAPPRLSDAPEAPLEREATLHAKRVHEVHVHLPNFKTVGSTWTLVKVDITVSQPGLLRAAPPELCQVVLVLLRTLPSACLPDEARLPAKASAPSDRPTPP